MAKVYFAGKFTLSRYTAAGGAMYPPGYPR